MRGVFGLILASMSVFLSPYLSFERRLVWKHKYLSPETLGMLRQQLRRMGYTPTVDVLETIHFCRIPHYKLRVRFRSRYPGMTLEQKKQKPHLQGRCKKEEKIRCRCLYPVRIPFDMIHKRSIKVREEWILDPQVRISIDFPQSTVECKLSLL